MRIKSYFTYTVESAVALAQSELGDDALLVSARRSPPDSPDGARYEVIPRLRLIGTLNAIANKYCGQYQYIAYLGDDHRIRTPAWDRLLVEAIQDLPFGIAYGNDLTEETRRPSAVLMQTDIVKTLGYMAPPSLLHACKEDFWRDLGNALGTLRYREDVVLELLHHSGGNPALDVVDPEACAPAVVERDHAAYRRYAQRRMSLDIAKFSI